MSQPSNPSPKQSKQITRSQQRHQHQHERLATGPVGIVDRCCCGVVQLHVGSATLRLDDEAFQSLFATMGRAIAAQTAARTASPLDLGAVAEA